MLTASQKLGGSKITLLKYANSGDVSGDTAAVVGYAAIIVE
jgi:AmmeMemoRadiSam system protein B